MVLGGCVIDLQFLLSDAGFLVCLKGIGTDWDLDSLCHPPDQYVFYSHEVPQSSPFAMLTQILL